MAKVSLGDGEAPCVLWHSGSVTDTPSFVLSKRSQIRATLGSDLELWPRGSVFDLPLLRGASITSFSCCENAQG